MICPWCSTSFDVPGRPDITEVARRGDPGKPIRYEVAVDGVQVHECFRGCPNPKPGVG